MHAQPAALRTIMPPLVLKWQALGDTDRELLPLLECLTSLAQALGPAFEPYAEAMYERCMRIVAMQLQARRWFTFRLGLVFRFFLSVCWSRLGW